MASLKRTVQKSQDYTHDHPSRDAWSDERKTTWILYVTFAVAALFLLTNLGHYSLWDDESMDALSAQSVLENGGTTAKVGHNIVAYRHGLLIMKKAGGAAAEPDTELHLGMPPLTAYVSAFSMAIFGENAFAARLPSALFGLACVGLMLSWLRKSGASPATAAVFGIVLLGNVSFFLYARQCRYYGVSMFLFVLGAYLYLHQDGRRRQLLALGGCLAALMLANPLFFVFFSAAMVCDYLFWQRKARPLGFMELVWVYTPQLLAGLALLKWWNPLATPQQSYLVQNTLAERLTLFWWNLRDLNRGEMIVGALLLISPILAFFLRLQWLKRALCALLVYMVGLTLLSTQTIKITQYADIRYLSALLPLGIFIQASALRSFMALIAPGVVPSIVAALAVFSSNFFYGGLFFQEGMRLTVCEFVHELIAPPNDPYTLTAQWINNHVREGESVYVVPGHMMYPLIFHAPKALYAWQLTYPPEPRFSKLPAIEFEGVLAPDYMIAFGPAVQDLQAALGKWTVASYAPVEGINFFWKDVYRPEIFWREFNGVQNFNPQLEAIYIFKKNPTPAPTLVP